MRQASRSTPTSASSTTRAKLRLRGSTVSRSFTRTIKRPSTASGSGCVALGRPLESNVRVMRSDGVYRWMHSHISPLKDDRGSITRWYGLLSDIDDQRAAEERLRRSERELRLRRSDSVYRWFNSRGTPMTDAEGGVVRWYALLTDIDDRKSAEDALRSTEARLSRARQAATVAELSASIAHEINQPLASVVTNAHACETWLSHDPPNLERALTTLERIIRDGHSAAEVVR